MKTKRTEITIETHSFMTIRVRGNQPLVHCERCQKRVATFAPDQIAKFLQLNLTEICRRIETNQIHLSNSSEGVALICGESLEEIKNPDQKIRS